jgi:hypothetical protein
MGRPTRKNCSRCGETRLAPRSSPTALPRSLPTPWLTPIARPSIPSPWRVSPSRRARPPIVPRPGRVAWQALRVAWPTRAAPQSEQPSEIFPWRNPSRGTSGGSRQSLVTVTRFATGTRLAGQIRPQVEVRHQLTSLPSGEDVSDA